MGERGSERERLLIDFAQPGNDQLQRFQVCVELFPADEAEVIGNRNPQQVVVDLQWRLAAVDALKGVRLIAVSHVVESIEQFHRSVVERVRRDGIARGDFESAGDQAAGQADFAEGVGVGLMPPVAVRGVGGAIEAACVADGGFEKAGHCGGKRSVASIDGIIVVEIHGILLETRVGSFPLIGDWRKAENPY